MKESNYTDFRPHTGADYMNDGPPRAEFAPESEPAFVPVNGKSGLLAGAALVGVGLFSILAPGAASGGLTPRRAIPTLIEHTNRERLSELREGVLFCLHFFVAAGAFLHHALTAPCRARQRVRAHRQGPPGAQSPNSGPGCPAARVRGCRYLRKKPPGCISRGALEYGWVIPRWGPARGR